MIRRAPAQFPRPSAAGSILRASDQSSPTPKKPLIIRRCQFDVVIVHRMIQNRVRTRGNQGEEYDFRPDVVNDSGLKFLCTPCQKQRILSDHCLLKVNEVQNSFKVDGTSSTSVVRTRPGSQRPEPQVLVAKQEGTRSCWHPALTFKSARKRGSDRSDATAMNGYTETAEFQSGAHRRHAFTTSSGFRVTADQVI